MMLRTLHLKCIICLIQKERIIKTFKKNLIRRYHLKAGKFGMDHVHTMPRGSLGMRPAHPKWTSPGVPWWFSGLRIWCGHHCDSGYCCDMSSMPGLGTSAYFGRAPHTPKKGTSSDSASRKKAPCQVPEINRTG